MISVNNITGELLMLEYISISNHIISVIGFIDGNRKRGLYPALHPDEAVLSRRCMQMEPVLKIIIARLIKKKKHADLPFFIKTCEWVNWKNEKI